MKIYRIATPERSIDIKMPNFLFWLFKKLAKVETAKAPHELVGSCLPIAIFDEAERVERQEGK